MSWLPIVILSYLVLAVSTLVDKFFLSQVIASSRFYVMWVSALSVLAFLAAPAASWIGWDWFVIACIAGAVFTLSLALLYKALKVGEASRVAPLVGGSIPLIIFLFSLIFRLELFTTHTIIAFISLLLGTILITIMPDNKRQHTDRHWMWWSLGAGISFAAFFLLTKLVFSNQTSINGFDNTFINGIVWPRVGTLVVLIVMMFWKKNRSLLAHPFSKVSWKLRWSLISNQALAAFGFLGQNYAIKLGGSLSLITALQGVQYAFILLLAALASWKTPQVLKEYVSFNIIMQKIAALVLIAIGLYYSAF